MPQLSIGLDFGTSNTVLALADGEGGSKVVTFDHRGEALTGFISALCFWQQRIKGVNTSRVEGGPWAVDEFLEGLDAHRFIQSFKSFAASGAFRDTRIFSIKYEFEDLLAAFLKTVFRHGKVDPANARLVIGRPVRFAGGNPDPALAMQRYRNSLARLGIEAAHYVYEPVGAAFFYARELKQDSTVLVADFGGGTSDFSVMRFETSGGVRRARALGHAGIGIAGDTFDYRIIDNVISPRLGKGANYRSFGKVLGIPSHYFVNFARWNHLRADEVQWRPEGASRTDPQRRRSRSAGTVRRDDRDTTSAFRSTGRSRAPRSPCRHSRASISNSRRAASTSAPPSRGRISRAGSRRI